MLPFRGGGRRWKLLFPRKMPARVYDSVLKYEYVQPLGLYGIYRYMLPNCQRVLVPMCYRRVIYFDTLLLELGRLSSMHNARR